MARVGCDCFTRAVPIAFLIEAAGSAATDGIRRILDIGPSDLHDYVPLCFGERIRDHVVRS